MGNCKSKTVFVAKETYNPVKILNGQADRKFELLAFQVRIKLILGL